VASHKPLAILIALCAAGPAAAQIRPYSVEVTPQVGLWEGDAVLENGPTFGASLGFNVNQIFGIEANYAAVLSTLDPNTTSLSSSTTKKAKEDKTIHQFGLNGVLHLADGPLVPYLTAGAGFVSVDETEFAHNIGVGAKYFVTDLIGVRLDFRGWFSPDAPAQDEYAHFAAMLGADFQFGGDNDIDDDGILNRDDKCSSVAEDRDGFKDDDGCPEKDNDEDGVADESDKCPMQAEDKDGDRDDDGCPDLDDDGDGIENDADKCPKEAEDKDGFEDTDGCPDADNDKDGVLDADDKCADSVEDKDGFEDTDGCADLDNDKDGIPDASDKCPGEAEVVNGVDDTDGCPDQGLVKLSDKKIEILEKVYFVASKDTIEEKSNVLLSQIASVLKSKPGIKKIEIQGYTDNSGNAKKNTILSQKRAEAVKKFLIDNGIEAGRLEAKGYGDANPIADNKTKEGRETNRRVEFSILEQQ
jgi:outer membrane protein OmpA-like peptidoglycan-associated protein